MTNNNNKHHDGDKWFWAGDIIIDKVKRPKHRDGDKWFYVRWDYKSNCHEYWLIYTTTTAEDDELLADDDRWVKISREFAIDLTKRDGQRWNTVLSCNRGNYDWLWHIITEAQRDKGRHWLPIFPFCVDNDADYKIKDRVVVKA